ncbi:MAG: tail fiber domain-containing protein [Candidatus Paceibacterota bacterium]
MNSIRNAVILIAAVFLTVGGAASASSSVSFSANFFNVFSETTKNAAQEVIEGAVMFPQNIKEIIAGFIQTQTPNVRNTQTPAQTQKTPNPAENHTLVVQSSTGGTKTIVERTIEKIISGVTPEQLEEKLQTLNNKILSSVQNLKNQLDSRTYSPANATVASTYQALALTNKIDNLYGVTINNATITGALSGLTDAMIPDNITASNYLPLAGGTLTGAITGTNLVLSGNLTVSGAQTLSGAITIPYLAATSTTATSTFSGGFTAGTNAGLTVNMAAPANSLYINSAGNVGIGTTSPVQKLDIEKGHIRLGQVAAPSAPTVAVGGAGVLTGNYYYRISFVTVLGETETILESVVVAPVNQQVNLTNIPVSADSAVIARKIYRNAASGIETLLKLRLVTTINNNTTTTYTDNIADALLGVYEPKVNTTGGMIYNSETIVGVADRTSTVWGYNAFPNRTGWYNTAIGRNALYANTYGYFLTAVGYDALQANTSGYYNVGLGNNAFYFNTTGYQGTAVGGEALYNNTTGYSNTGIGFNALNQNLTGNENTAVGDSALYYLLSGNFNTAIGEYAAFRNSTASGNTAIGAYALKYNRTGGYNTVIGNEAGNGVSNNSFSDNSLFGYQSGYGLTTGSYNILVGVKAGDNLTSGSKNIVLGYDIDAPSPTSANTLNIGNLIFATGVDGTGTTLSTGNVGIGTTTPGYKLTVKGTAAFPAIVNDGTGYSLCLNVATGQMATSSTGCGTSALRFKENIEALSYGLKDVLNLRPVFFNWKESYLSDRSRQLGFIADEVADVIPEVVGRTADGVIQNLDYAKLTAVLVKAVQELNEKIVDSSQYVSNQTASGFEGLLAWLEDKVVRAKEFVADKITAKKVVTEFFEMKDGVTGETWCVRIMNGEWDKFKGTCGEVSSTNTPVEPPMSNIEAASTPVISELSPIAIPISTPETNTATTTPQ